MLHRDLVYSYAMPWPELLVMFERTFRVSYDVLFVASDSDVDAELEWAISRRASKAKGQTVAKCEQPPGRTTCLRSASHRHLLRMPTRSATTTNLRGWVSTAEWPCQSRVTLRGTLRCAKVFRHLLQFCRRSLG